MLLGATAARSAGGPAFLHGVASGDPLPDGVLLWTRITPSPDAVPGSGLGADTAVGWETAEDRAFSRTVASGTTVARARSCGGAPLSVVKEYIENQKRPG